MKQQRFAAFLLVLVPASVIALVGAPAVGDQRMPSPAAAPILSEAAVEGHIGYLADDALEGREAGTPGCRKAEEYILAAFRAAGLDAVEDQPFEFVAGARLGQPNTLAIAGTPLSESAFRPLAFSRSGKGVWPAVFAGYGIEATDLGHNDYAGIDVKDKLVVVLDGAPGEDNPHGKFGDHATRRAKALAASAKGARALLVLIGGAPEKQELPRFRGRDISRDVGLPVVAVKAAAAAALGVDVAAAAGALDAHREVSRDLGVTVALETTVDLERRRTRNILGWLRARHPEARDEVVIVGAHHDHLGRGGSSSLARKRIGEIHNGADDNASGVAGVIELARHLKTRAGHLRRHVLFMTFGGEELGLLGSKHFKSHPLLRIPAAGGAAETPVRAVAMMNLDMIGRLRKDRLLASGLATSDAWADLLERVRQGRHASLHVEGSSDKELVASSDHISFYQMGMPVVFFFTGNHRQYHSPDDDLYRVGDDGTRERLINVAGLVRVVRYIGDVVEEVANRPTSLPYRKGVKLAPRMSFRVVLRLLPDYGADVDGMQVAAVSPEGPAEKAGMKAGDVIVRFGETPVHSVRDYMVGLQKAKPDEPVEVEVVRGDKRIVLEAVPAGKR